MGTATAHKARAGRSAGFTLIEIAIVLVVMALVLGGSLTLFLRKISDDRYEAAREMMNAISDSVALYAARNRTAQRYYTVGTGASARVYELPAGRPYLPCPDYDGDGWEDRTALPDPPETAISGDDALTDTYGVCENPDTTVTNRLLARGMVPWRTLGMPPNDPWGNFFGYAVDPVYASALVGFDSSSKINIFDRRQPLEDTTETINGTTTNVLKVAVRADIHYPLLICAKSSCQSYDNMVDGALVGAAVTDIPDEYDEDTELFWDFPNGDVVVDGVAFAIISHGSSGGGGVVRNATEARFTAPMAGTTRPTIADTTKPICRYTAPSSEGGEATTASPTDLTGGSMELLNASSYYCEAVSVAGTATDISPTLDGGPAGKPAHLGSLPRIDSWENDASATNANWTLPSKDGNDDVLAWMTHAQLEAALDGMGVFPVPSFPYLVP